MNSAKWPGIPFMSRETKIRFSDPLPKNSTLMAVPDQKHPDGSGLHSTFEDSIYPEFASRGCGRAVRTCRTFKVVILRACDFFEFGRKLALITKELSGLKWPKIEKSHRL
jgi:hypothetical protein